MSGSTASHLAARLEHLWRTFFEMPTHSRDDCLGGSEYKKSFCAAKQFAKFTERFASPLWEEIHRSLCVNPDLSDPVGHDDLCDQARTLNEQVERKRVEALGEMIKHGPDEHREVLGLHLMAAGGLPGDKAVSAVSA